MTIKIKKEVEEEIEVTLPYYADHGIYFYKIESETKIIGVMKLDQKEKGIEIRTDGKWLIDIILTDTTPRTVTKEEFDKLLMNNLSHVNHFAFMQETEAASDEEIREEMILETNENPLNF